MTMHDAMGWLRETNRQAAELLDAALSAGPAGDTRACGQAAYGAALVFVRRFLEAAERIRGGGDLVELVARAAAADPYFGQVRGAAQLLASAASGDAPADCEQIVDAVKEIRLLSGERAGTALGFKKDSPEHGPPLSDYVVHSTTVERAASIFAQGALYSFAECVRRGLLSGEPPGVKHLLDPRRCTECVIFGSSDPVHYAGEKVANAHRKGWIDEGLEEDYQPSVRLFFPASELKSLPGYQDDGCHILMVRDMVSLEHLAFAVFPTAGAQEAALRTVADEGRRSTLGCRRLIAPAECCSDPRSYVRGTNALARHLIQAQATEEERGR